MQSDKLYFFSNSADKKPGIGVNEFVTDPNRYGELARTTNWRRILSNFWVAPFAYKGVTFRTVEHMFQGYKIWFADPTRGLLFTVESGSSIGLGDGEVARANRKLVTLNAGQLKKWEEMKDDVLFFALKAKFTQYPNLAKVLLATGNAELWHGAPRVAPERQWTLEEVRKELCG